MAFKLLKSFNIRLYFLIFLLSPSFLKKEREREKRKEKVYWK